MQSRKIHNACSLSIAQGEKQWCRPAIAKVRYPQREITNQGPRVRVRVSVRLRVRVRIRLRVRVRVEGLGTYKTTDI